MSKKKGKKGKKNKKQEEEDIELATCPNCDEQIPAESTECPECGQEFVDEEEIDEPVEEVVDEIEEPEDEEIETGPLEIKKTGLIIGVILSFAGVIGVIGLRQGFIQSLLGDAAPYPGIGTAEPIGHIVSIIPTILGLVMILSWGIKNDSIYYELEKIKKDDTHEEDEIEEDEIEEFAPAEDEIEEFTPVDDSIPSEFSEPLEDVPEEELDEDTEIDALDELEDVLDDITQEIEEAPMEVPTSVKDELAEQIRTERCEKMLTTAVMLPDDKEKLKELIPTGLSAADFTEEVKKAIERRKNREEEDDVTADEKASILEDELVAELADLEDELDEDMEGDDLEDQILKEIEDLEDL
ncbi:MAG: hypothetical protein KAJ64_01865 [Thermoplasmata archaeon]|nr:hypothetical protein [Thermoplasmata archaeon]